MIGIEKEFSSIKNPDQKSAALRAYSLYASNLIGQRKLQNLLGLTKESSKILFNNLSTVQYSFSFSYSLWRAIWSLSSSKGSSLDDIALEYKCRVSDILDVLRHLSFEDVALLETNARNTWSRSLDFQELEKSTVKIKKNLRYICRLKMAVIFKYDFALDIDDAIHSCIERGLYAVYRQKFVENEQHMYNIFKLAATRKVETLRVFHMTGSRSRIVSVPEDVVLKYKHTSNSGVSEDKEEKRRLWEFNVRFHDIFKKEGSEVFESLFAKDICASELSEDRRLRNLSVRDVVNSLDKTEKDVCMNILGSFSSSEQREDLDKCKTDKQFLDSICKLHGTDLRSFTNTMRKRFLEQGYDFR